MNCCQDFGEFLMMQGMRFVIVGSKLNEGSDRKVFFESSFILFHHFGLNFAQKL